MSSKKKLLAVLSVALFVSLLSTYLELKIIGNIVAIVLVFWGFNRHISRCRSCQSWRTYVEGHDKLLPINYRICLVCKEISIVSSGYWG